MAKKRKKEKKTTHNNSNKLKHKIEEKVEKKPYILLFLAIPLIFFIFGGGYYIGTKSSHNITEKTTHKIVKEKIIPKTVEKIVDKESDTQRRLKLLKEIELVQIVEKPAIVKKELDYISPLHELDGKTKIPPQDIKRDIIIIEEKPKLAIIIDDMSTKSQVNAIKSLNMPLTMSFLPPSPARPHSAELASKEKFYMVHLPMEAQHFTAEEPLTLRVEDSQQKISERVAQLKKLFPKVKYINNHTGSKFTADEKAMNKLIYVLNKNHINFIDSRTTAKTKAPIVMKNFGKKYVSRDVFLDNKNEKEYILGQIKKAIKVAKRYGTAIAICHPHPTTILALHSAKKLLQDVQLVYINQID